MKRGKLKTAPAEKANQSDFLKFNSRDGLLKNFMENFLKQFNEPKRFGLYKVLADNVEQGVANLKTMLQNKHNPDNQTQRQEVSHKNVGDFIKKVRAFLENLPRFLENKPHFLRPLPHPLSSIQFSHFFTMSYNKKAVLAANTAAIGLLLRLEKEQRTATEEEQKVLRAYQGFGGLKCILNRTDQPEDIRYWAKSEQDLFAPTCALKQLIYREAPSADMAKRYWESIKASVLTSFYTDTRIVNAIADSLEENLEVLRNEGKDISKAMLKGLEKRKQTLEVKLHEIQDSIAERKDDAVDFKMMHRGLYTKRVGL